MYQIAVNFRFFMPFNFGWKAYFSACGWGVELLFFLPAAGALGSAPNLLTKVPAFLKTEELAARAWTFIFLPAAEAWGSAPNLLTKVPAFFENGGTRGQQSAFQTHFR